MAPSATLPQLEPKNLKAPESCNGLINPAAHAHGSEDLTPLQAMSHGPLVLGGKIYPESSADDKSSIWSDGVISDNAAERFWMYID